MKISELRKQIDRYSTDQLKILVAEMYKALPKRAKEDHQIDELILTPTSESRSTKKNSHAPTVGDLQLETEEFVSNAYGHLYLVPNRTVSKRDRPKWRFIARRLFKQLIKVGENPDGLPQAAQLMEKLYGMLCYSCAYTLFTAYDTFESLGVAQTDFFRELLRLKSRCEKPRDFVRDVVHLAVDSRLNRYTVYEDLMGAALEFLQTADLLEMAVQACDQMREEIKRDPPKGKSSSWGCSQGSYEHTRRLENLATMGFLCYSALCEYDQAVDYFRRHYPEKEPEIALYVLLHLLLSQKCPQQWICVYEEAVDRGVRPREQLRKAYELIQSQGRLQACF